MKLAIILLMQGIHNHSHLDTFTILGTNSSSSKYIKDIFPGNIFQMNTKIVSTNTKIIKYLR